MDYEISEEALKKLESLSPPDLYAFLKYAHDQFRLCSLLSYQTSPAESFELADEAKYWGMVEDACDSVLNRKIKDTIEIPLEVLEKAEKLRKMQEVINS